MSDALTPREVADELGVTVRTVQRWITMGRLPAQRVGSRLRVSRSSLSTVGGEPHTPITRRPIRTLLIANRGEIAARVNRTARALGIHVVRVYSLDEPAPTDADTAYAIGSYLDGDEILAVARRAGADAIHPGYGFLAENAAFAASVTDAGLAWVGPPTAAIAAMGDKAAARRLAAEKGVEVLPGYDGAAQDDATLGEQAHRIGYPLLVKPSVGGGGKGMHVVRAAADLPEALAAARREAGRAFGDDRLILERYLDGARHVEVQVLFDGHGGGVHLGERDCSAQRRSQKIVEEAPAPSVSDEVRARMGAAALSVAAAVGYESAGTVEFLVDDRGSFAFIEMNTRLQVEHPVTEAVTGRDLVADQLKVAEGATLASLGLRRPPATRGHAIEARLYAEDPDAGFLPASGRIARLAWPSGIRIDAGVTEGDVVSERFDPLLAKLIAHAPTRAAALDHLRAALDQTLVLGVRTNLRFLRRLLAAPEMAAAEVRTDTVERLLTPDADPPQPSDKHWHAAAAALRRAGDADPWSGGWRLNATPVLRVASGEEERSVPLELGRLNTAPPPARDGDRVHVDVDGQSVEFRLAPPPTIEAAARHAAAHGAADASVLTAPMPGRVIAVRVVEGAPVEAHQPVVVIEAMKMEHAVTAPAAGTLARLLVREGDQVQRGDLLAEVAALALDQ